MRERRRRVRSVLLAGAAMAPVLSCGPPGPKSAALPESRTPCAERTSPSPGASPPATPRETRLAWRAEEMKDGSVRMTVGDVAAAPRQDGAVRTADHTRPVHRTDCENVRIVKVRGWWCTYSAGRVAVSGEIVVGGAEPRASIRGAGFAARCSGRPARMRQVYRIERDSWSGWRGYGPPRETAWTRGGAQDGGPVTEACPLGRVGSYNYRLSVRLRIDGVAVGESYATGPRVRADCGTGAG